MPREHLLELGKLAHEIDDIAFDILHRVFIRPQFKLNVLSTFRYFFNYNLLKLRQLTYDQSFIFFDHVSDSV